MSLKHYSAEAERMMSIFEEDGDLDPVSGELPLPPEPNPADRPPSLAELPIIRLLAEMRHIPLVADIVQDNVPERFDTKSLDVLRIFRRDFYMLVIQLDSRDPNFETNRTVLQTIGVEEDLELIEDAWKESLTVLLVNKRCGNTFHGETMKTSNVHFLIAQQCLPLSKSTWL